jgi:hypothetical protein
MARKGAKEEEEEEIVVVVVVVHKSTETRLHLCTLSTDVLVVKSNVSIQLWLFLTMNVEQGYLQRLAFSLFALYTTTIAIPLQLFLFFPNTFHSLSDPN